MFMDYYELREHKRTLAETETTVNDGSPYQGGTLFDVSPGGASITYPQQATPNSEPIAVGQDLILIFNNRIKKNGRVARLFDGGFAVAFDSSYPW